MSFTITLYKNKAENERLDKSAYLSNPIALTGTLRQETSVVHPVIRITTNTNISTYNYCEIPTFGRKYFITDIKSIRNGVWEISLECDVLYTYKDKIGNCKAYIDKQEFDHINKMIDDGTYILPEDEAIDILKFEGGETLLKSPESYHYILMHI